MPCPGFTGGGFDDCGKDPVDAMSVMFRVGLELVVGAMDAPDRTATSRDAVTGRSTVLWHGMSLAVLLVRRVASMALARDGDTWREGSRLAS